jgi:hypothetical protein
MARLHATLLDLDFEGDPAALAGATYTVDPDGIKGWLDGVDMRRENVPRPGAHGEFDVPGYLGARFPSIAGAVHAASATALRDAIHALTGALADGGEAELAVDIAGQVLTAMVRRHGAPEITMVNPNSTALYRLQLWSADPRRYGALHTYGPSASVASITHDGNFPALPTLVIAGTSGGGYTVNGPSGYLVTVTEPLVGGSPHTLDLSTGALYIGSTRILGGVTAFKPWTVPAGASITVSVTAGTVQVEVRDTFA